MTLTRFNLFWDKCDILPNLKISIIKIQTVFNLPQMQFRRKGSDVLIDCKCNVTLAKKKKEKLTQC